MSFASYRRLAFLTSQYVVLATTRCLFTNSPQNIYTLKTLCLPSGGLRRIDFLYSYKAGMWSSSPVRWIATYTGVRQSKGWFCWTIPCPVPCKLNEVNQAWRYHPRRLTWGICNIFQSFISLCEYGWLLHKSIRMR